MKYGDFRRALWKKRFKESLSQKFARTRHPQILQISNIMVILQKLHSEFQKSDFAHKRVFKHIKNFKRHASLTTFTFRFQSLVNTWSRFHLQLHIKIWRIFQRFRRRHFDNQHTPEAMQSFLVEAFCRNHSYSFSKVNA